MAKAQFQKHQRVWVEAVGCWAVIERIIPVWVKSFDEPARITYDVGLGREFTDKELRAEAPAPIPGLAREDRPWRVLRMRNKWQEASDCAHHPFPGTFPVVVTDQADWGGWRVPGAEYDRAPERMEAQARLIAAAPRLARVARALAAIASEAGDDAPPALVELGKEARDILRAAAAEPVQKPAPAAREAPPRETAA
jgi:hypothetical protein